MVNWDFLEPRNLAVIALFSVLGIGIYSQFAARMGKKGS